MWTMDAHHYSISHRLSLSHSESEFCRAEHWFLSPGTMENIHDTFTPPRESENACDIAVESSEGELLVFGQTLLVPASSISLSDNDLKDLSVEEVLVEECLLREENGEVAKPETVSNSVTRTLELEPKTDGNSDSQWKGFIRKLKKGPTMNLHSFHPSILNLPSIKKLSRRRTRNTQSLPGLPTHIEVDLYYCFETSWKSFSLSDLEEATDNFSHDNLIGEGGYSEVYRGHLKDGQLVAVKRLIRGTQEEMTADYLSELGILIHVNHPNIANVIGYGVEGGMHLVLPLSPHGNLASSLNGKSGKLAWNVRYNIALGIASGLSYLHEGCQRRIIHRDIKSANILLTEDFEPQAKPLLNRKSIVDLVDPSLNGVYDYDQVSRMSTVASLCIHHNSSERPQMSQVVSMLKCGEGIMQSKKKFQKRPALKRTYPLELISEEECNPDKF
ncbi:receptor-like cytosolic serine/threonine-protein kinase RBK2 isoform X2 [Primulina huaijiensis]|uniref:receptor-like cytosolic serine/threonine-protein kinase RBK2 isoform X2 n=1 Tax=Primulina huaijiensis TaxID=1492673 RepID=UPI003CC70749